jgi:hypothetical protein
MGGFTCIGSLSSNYDGKGRTYAVPSSHASLIAIGDVVTETGTADANGDAQVDVATASTIVTGVIVGIKPDYSTEALGDIKIAASTAGTVIVNCDPNAEYEVDVSNGPLVLADVGLNANLVATAATTSGGLTTSNMTLNATGVATTATLQFRIVRLLTSAAGVLGGRAVVRVNKSINNTGGTGI